MRSRILGAAGFAICFVLVYGQPTATSWSALTFVRSLDLEGATDHVQGVEFSPTTLWATSVDSESRKGYLRQFSFTTGKLERTVEIQDGVRFHPGGLASDETSLWTPVAEYRAKSSAVVQRRNKRTLALEFSFDVADHIGCIAVTPEYLIGGNWDSRDFYVWDHEGKLLRKVASDTKNAYQDWKVNDGILVASGLLADKTGAIDWLELPSFRLIKRLPAGVTDRKVPFTREGMAIRGEDLVLLPEDSPSRAFVFRFGR